MHTLVQLRSFLFDQVKLIYLGRFINGLSFGAVTVAVPLYNNEIAEDRVRGSVGVYLDLMLCIGILWSYVVGAISSYYWLSVSCLMIPVLFLFTFFWMPESPVHLLAKGKAEDAEMALRWANLLWKFWRILQSINILNPHYTVAGFTRFLLNKKQKFHSGDYYYTTC